MDPFPPPGQPALAGLHARLRALLADLPGGRKPLSPAALAMFAVSYRQAARCLVIEVDPKGDGRSYLGDFPPVQIDLGEYPEHPPEVLCACGAPKCPSMAPAVSRALLWLAEPPGEEAPKRDLEQTRQAIDGARALVPLLEPRHGEQLGPVKDALSRLQMAYVQLSGGKPQPAETPKADDPGPAQSSGRLWVPGQ